MVRHAFHHGEKSMEQMLKQYGTWVYRKRSICI